MTDTHFANPHGLDAPGHYTTADDLAVLARYAMTKPAFRRHRAAIARSRSARGAHKRTLLEHGPAARQLSGRDGRQDGQHEWRRLLGRLGGPARGGVTLYAIVLGTTIRSAAIPRRQGAAGLGIRALSTACSSPTAGTVVAEAPVSRLPRSHGAGRPSRRTRPSPCSTLTGTIKRDGVRRRGAGAGRARASGWVSRRFGRDQRVVATVPLVATREGGQAQPVRSGLDRDGSRLASGSSADLEPAVGMHERRDRCCSADGVSYCAARIGSPHFDERWSPRMSDDLKRTPLYEEHLALGARMVPFAGWEMPVQYAGIIEEHRAVRRSAGVFDVSHMAEFRVFGFGAFDFLQRMLTNDLHKIAELGQAQYTLMLDDDGHIIDDLIVYHTGDLEYLIIANASQPRDRLRVACRSTRPPTSSSSTSPTARRSSRCRAPRRCASSRSSRARAGSRRRASRSREASLDTIPALVARTGYTGEDGVEIVIARSARRRALARDPLVSRGHSGGSRRARHAAPRDGLPALRQRHGSHRSIRSRQDWAGSCPRPRPATSAPRRSRAVRERGTCDEARRAHGRGRHSAARVCACCTRASRSVR